MQFSRKSLVVLLAFFVALLERSFFPVFFNIPFPLMAFNTTMLLATLNLKEETLLFSFAVGLFLDMLAYQFLGLTSLILVLMTLLVFAFKRRISDWIPAYYSVGLLSLILLGFNSWGLGYVSPAFLVGNVLGFSVFTYLVIKLHVR